MKHKSGPADHQGTTAILCHRSGYVIGGMVRFTTARVPHAASIYRSTERVVAVRGRVRLWRKAWWMPPVHARAKLLNASNGAIIAEVRSEGLRARKKKRKDGADVAWSAAMRAGQQVRSPRLPACAWRPCKSDFFAYPRRHITTNLCRNGMIR